MLYMGNVLPGCETYRWNVSSVQTVRAKNRNINKEVQFIEKVSMRTIWFYKATVQKVVCVLRH